jgi:hypothetical protein
VSSSNKQSDDQIDHPDKTYAASAHSASAKSAHHRFSPNGVGPKVYSAQSALCMDRGDTSRRVREPSDLPPQRIFVRWRMFERRPGLSIGRMKVPKVQGRPGRKLQ